MKVQLIVIEQLFNEIMAPSKWDWEDSYYGAKRVWVGRDPLYDKIKELQTQFNEVIKAVPSEILGRV